MGKINLKDPSVYPILIIGSYVNDFKKSIKIPMYHVENLNDVKDFVSYYSGIKYLDRPVVLEDISFLNKQVEGQLLKFIEETSLKVIVLSYYDKNSLIFLSRFKTVVKAMKDKTTSLFLTMKQGYSKIEQATVENTPYYQRVALQGKNSPELYYYDKLLRYNRNYEKIIDILI